MDEYSYHQQFGLSLAKGEPGTSIPLLTSKGGGKGNGKLDSSSSGNSSSDEVGANTPAASSVNASPVRYYASLLRKYYLNSETDFMPFTST